MAPGDDLLVGRIARAHGINGEVSVEPLTEVADRFAPGATFRAGENDTMTVEGSRRHQKRVLVKFEGVDDRTAAESLRGTLLFIGVDEARDLPEGSFWPRDLVGCEVVTEDGRVVGPITEVLANPANDLWITDRGMIPAVREVVVAVDLDARRVTIREVPGLLEEG